MKLKTKLIRGLEHPSLIWSYFSKQRRAFSTNVSFYINHLRNKKNLIFEITSPGEFWYVEPIWNKLKKDKHLKIYFSVGVNNDITGLCWSDYMSLLTSYGISRREIIPSYIKSLIHTADLFLSPTAYTSGVPMGSMPRIQIFHGLASKGKILLENVLQFNILFLTGPNLKEMFERDFVKQYPQARQIQIFEVGYPKSDALINKSYNREKIMRDLSIDPNKPTVIYAPTYERTASLHKMGHEIIQTLAKMDINLLVKLHHGSLRSPNDFNATGGINWRKELKKYQQAYTNVTPIFDFNANPYLYVSDVMVTDVSGVGFEFMLLDKPIIYIDVPEFFEQYGHGGIEDWGRYAGIIVKKPEELPEAIQKCLNNPTEQSPQRRELISKLVYNPGDSAEKTAQVILQLLRGKWR